jgi:hypothetical protein
VTLKKVTDKMLEKAARAANLPQYEQRSLPNGWTGRVGTVQGSEHHAIGSVHLYSEWGHRGIAPSLDAADGFARANSDPSAHWDVTC